jgi:hypothetical protein
MRYLPLTALPGRVVQAQVIDSQQLAREDR